MRLRLPLLLLAGLLVTACAGLPGSGGRSEASSDLQAVTVPAIAPTVRWHVTPPPPAVHDLWTRLRAGYGLPQVPHDRVAGELDWYAGHQAYLDRVVERARRYLYYIVGECEARGMPTELALLPVVESAFDPFAYSHGRAAGLWQFIPGTGRMYSLDQDWWHDERRDVVASTRAALDHLQDLHDSFDGDWLLALAAYNSGSGNVSRALRENREKGRPLDFFSLDLPRETESYVPRLLAIAELVADPAAHGVTLASLPDKPYFEIVDTGGQIDLARAADLAGVDGRELYMLNPGLNRWATHPDGPNRLLVPAGHGATLAEGLAELPPGQRITWERHRIRPGDTLSTIAARYNTDVDTIRNANSIRGSRIRAGDALLIPVAAAAPETYALSESARQAARNARNARGHVAEHHEVRAGESFWSIARHYGVDMNRLATWNGMAIADPLRPGQDLVIWRTPPVRLADNTPLKRDPVVRKLGYRVRSGDSLARIASRFGVSVSDIVSWNALNRARYLQPGQRLTLFVDVTSR